MQEESPRYIGKYRVLGTLGRGALGIVYRAEDPEIGRVVAIKIMRQSLPGEKGAATNDIERFKLEARSAGNLRHPNIITLFEVANDGDTPYLVMDYIEGTTLDVIIKEEGSILFPDLLKFIDQLAAGIDYAHQQGVIHRDIKPSNIMIDNQGSAYILDFGVAAIKSLGTTNSQDTAIVGTPAYMAPELISQGRYDHRSDLFSFAVMLFEMLAGKRPFIGDGQAGVMSSIVHNRHRSVRDINPSLPREFDLFFERVLAKHPEARFQSARELVDGFRKEVSKFPQLTDPPDPDARKRRDSTSTWRRVRQRKFSDLKIETPLPAVLAQNDTRIIEWEAAQEGVDPYGRLKGISDEVNSQVKPGESLFGSRAFGDNKVEGTSTSNSPTRIVTKILVGFSAFLTILLIALVIRSRAVKDSVSSEMAKNLEQPSSVTVPAVKLDPPPADKRPFEMSDSELLGLLVSGNSREADILNALNEVERRKPFGSIESLVTVLAADSAEIRIETIKILGRLGDKKAVPDLLPSLDDHDDGVRAVAAKALGALGDRRALGYLSSRLTREQNRSVKEAIAKAIERITGVPV